MHLAYCIQHINGCAHRLELAVCIGPLVHAPGLLYTAHKGVCTQAELTVCNGPLVHAPGLLYTAHKGVCTQAELTVCIMASQ